jgi:hypothetical protein
MQHLPVPLDRKAIPSSGPIEDFELAKVVLDED